MKLKKYQDVLIFLLVMIFSISLELAFDYLQVKEENIYLVFVLSILIIIIESKKIVYGLLASFITVLSFNFFITEPKYTFVVNDANNYVSFIIFIVVSFMVNYLVINLQRQTKLSKDNEDKINVLYNVSSDLLQANSIPEIYEMIIKRLKNSLKGETTILTKEEDIYGDQIDINDSSVIMKDALKNIYLKDNDLNDKRIYPIKSETNEYGILIVDKDNDDVFIQNVIEELLVALDKNYISNEQAKTKLEVEKEKFRTSLLRGLSHDLKTPLTMIQSGSDFLVNSYDEVNDETKISLIKDIYDESCDLSNFVNNLLDLTKLEDNKLSLNKRSESVQDVLFHVQERIKRRTDNFELKIERHNESIEVYADIELLTQVFLNLIDNAMTHTAKGTTAIIDYKEDDNNILFSISDNGGGIDEGKLTTIFDDFFSLTNKEDKKRSHGLGLSICKSIIEAHDGKIWAYNNDRHGMTFEFSIPRKKD